MYPRLTSQTILVSNESNTKRARKVMYKKINGSNEALPSFVPTFRSIDSHLAFNLSDFLAKLMSHWKKYEEKKKKKNPRANEIRGSPGKLVATLFRFKLSLSLSSPRYLPSDFDTVTRSREMWRLNTAPRVTGNPRFHIFHSEWNDEEYDRQR